MRERDHVPAGTPWGDTIGYSRAVRVGDTIHVSGTAAVADGGGTAFPGDSYRQARRCLELIETALREAGGSPEQVVRTRMYVTPGAEWEEVGRAHGEWFSETKPASTLVVVAGLIDPEMLVEIEAVAVL